MMKYFTKLVLPLVFIFVSMGIFVYPVFAVTKTGDVNINAVVPELPPEDVTLPEMFVPDVVDITDSSAGIIWITSKPMLCVINYGKTEDYGLVYQESIYTYVHEVLLDSLLPNTVYHFNIRCVDEIGNEIITPDYTFKTLALPLPASEEEIPLTPTAAILDSIADSTLYQILNALFTLISLFAVLLSIILPIVANLPLLSILDQFLSMFIFLGKKKWGIVYDGESKQPVPKAKVALYEFETKKLLESKLTNKLGEYGFEIKPGKYYLTVAKSDYNYPSKEVKIDYHEEVIEVKKDTSPEINIPVDANSAKVTYRLEFLAKASKFVNAIRLPVMAVGTILAVIFYAAYPTTLNYLIINLYSIIWIYELYKLTQIYSLGNIFNSATKAPLGHTTVRVYDEKSGKLISTQISDEHGYYSLTIKPGQYNIEASKPKFKPAEVKNVHMEKGSVVREKIYLNKL